MTLEFGTLLNCMDGRVQRNVAEHLLALMGVRYLDTVTTAGMVKHLAGEPTTRTPAILEDLEVSLTRHGSRQLAIAAHHDCAGNQVADADQQLQVASAVSFLQDRHPDLEVYGIWVDHRWTVHRITRR